MGRDIKDYVALILVTPKDFKRVAMLHTRQIRFLPAKKVFFVGSSEVGELLEKEKQEGVYGENIDRVGFIHENEILPMDDVHRVRSERLDGKASRGATGWYYQQFLKMSYAAMCEEEYYMVWDGDTVPCAEFSMFSQEEGSTYGTPYLDLKQEYHEEYFTTMARLIPGMKKVIGKSFISEHMLFRKDLMLKMIAKIESNDAIEGSSYWEKIFGCLTKEELNSTCFSEFETYGTFVALTSPSAYRLREWHSFRNAGIFFDPNKMSDRDFAWLGRDFFAASFEKGNQLLPANQNLFDNPYYQERLSARQMFEILREEAGQELHDVWWDEEAQGGKKEPEQEEDIRDFVPDRSEPGKDAIDPEEYKIYRELGEEYERTNVNQAYICYENAAFLCGDEKELAQIEARMERMRENQGVTVQRTAIVLVTEDDLDMLQHCMKSIYDHCAPSSYRFIVIDNASSDETLSWLQNCPYDIDLLVSDEKIGFASACNAGIQCSEPGEDILIFNCGVRMLHNSLFWLRMGLYHNETTGAVGGLSNWCDIAQMVNINFSKISQFNEYAKTENIDMEHPYEEKVKLDFFALLLKSDVIDVVGGLDENFTTKEVAVTDYAIRLRESSYQLFSCHNAFFYCRKRMGDEHREEEDRLFREKWNFDYRSSTGFSGKEAWLLHNIFSSLKKESLRILEIGTGVGDFLSALRYHMPYASVVGIERNSELLRYCTEGAVILKMDAETSELPFEQGYFDYILVREGEKERLEDAVLEGFYKYLKPGVEKRLY